MKMVKTGTDHPAFTSIPAFISATEQEHLRAHATGLREQGQLRSNSAGLNRYFLKIDQTTFCDSSVESIGARIITRLGLEDCRIDPVLGWILSYIEPGGFIHPHIDSRGEYPPREKIHLRCNVLVQGTDPSCYPVIDGSPREVHERSLWAFHASEIEHGTLTIAGGQPRIVYQFGFRVPADHQL